jgi:hypothetical protein
MAIIDKKGVHHGRIANTIYRTYRGKQIGQSKPLRVKQTVKTKEAGHEFGLCSSTAKTFRRAFGYAYKAHDGGMVNRLTGKVRKAVSTCMQKECGERDIHDAELQYLKGFQFNANSPLDSVLNARPQVQFTEDNKIKVYLPAIKIADIKGIKANKYILRLVGIGFNFKKEVYSYNSYREIEISNKQPWEGGEILLDEGFAKGRLVLLSMSLHGYTDDGYQGLDCVNSKEWSPCEIIGAWHAHGELDDTQITPSIVGLVTWPAVYAGNKLLLEIARLRANTTPKKPLVKGSEPSAKNSYNGSRPPGGDIPI